MAQTSPRITILLLAGNQEQAHRWMREHPKITARYVAGYFDICARTPGSTRYIIIGTFHERHDSSELMDAVTLREIKPWLIGKNKE